MRTLQLTTALIALYLVIISNGCYEAKTTERTHQQMVAQGKYLVTAMGCHDCHSPKIFTPKGPKVDPALELSGHPGNMPWPPLPEGAGNPEGWILFHPHGTASVGAWGMSFAANLTSHETGVGNWTEEQFITALRKGKYKGLEGSRNLLPLMPWEFYGQLTDDDLKSIFAYLKTTKPINNIPPSPIPPTDLNQGL